MCDIRSMCYDWMIHYFCPWNNSMYLLRSSCQSKCNLQHCAHQWHQELFIMSWICRFSLKHSNPLSLQGRVHRAAPHCEFERQVSTAATALALTSQIQPRFERIKDATKATEAGTAPDYKGFSIQVHQPERLNMALKKNSTEQFVSLWYQISFRTRASPPSLGNVEFYSGNASWGERSDVAV